MSRLFKSPNKSESSKSGKKGGVSEERENRNSFNEPNLRKPKKQIPRQIKNLSHTSSSEKVTLELEDFGMEGNEEGKRGGRDSSSFL